jgi:mannose-1-phosphate guanylyltransferase/mannose-6-phosphate isomerase
MKILLLCGGDGERLWPMSKTSLPKQFIKLPDGSTMFDRTISRLKNLGDVTVISNRKHLDHLSGWIQQNVSNDGASVILEPNRRNTAPAIAAGLMMSDYSDDDVVLVLPADHHIVEDDKFKRSIERGLASARRGDFVLFGVNPSFPSTQFGYINFIAPPENVDQGSLKVINFIEKPNLQKATEMLEQGGYMWNAGIFMARRDVFVNAFKDHALDVWRSLESCTRLSKIFGQCVYLEDSSFSKTRSVSFDFAVLEKLENLVVHPLECDWSDLGSWDAIESLIDPDKNGNRTFGSVVLAESKNTFVFADDSLQVAAVGLNDISLMATSQHIAIVKRDSVNGLNSLRRLRDDVLPQFPKSERVERPWGWYETMFSGPAYQVKKLCIYPLSSISLQSHEHRDEIWSVVEGKAEVTVHGRVWKPEKGEAITVGRGDVHRAANIGEIPVIIIEIQYGNYLGEDDIVRYEDQYGRK